MKKEVSNNFSVALGLFDYINPIFYSITSITIIKNMKDVMSRPIFVIMSIGICISIFFGLAIPTIKFLVGLGKMKFKMPVNLVFYVNSGIFITGLVLAFHCFKMSLTSMIIIAVASLIVLTLIYLKTKKFNTIAVLIGAIGYLLIYSSLITLAINKAYYIPIVLYSIAIILFLFLIVIGIKANLKDARVHWIIEISNVFCQMFVAIATIILFSF